jgi:hypothetical protein
VGLDLRRRSRVDLRRDLLLAADELQPA